MKAEVEAKAKHALAALDHHRAQHIYEIVDTPRGLKPDGFSVLRGRYPSPSPKALPKPFYVLCSVMVSMQAYAALWTGVPAD